jgi:energy-converting hydrogenase Eha subunit E
VVVARGPLSLLRGGNCTGRQLDHCGVRVVGLGLVFIFFSNRLGVVGSLLVSAVVTVILLVVFGVIELG